MAPPTQPDHGERPSAVPTAPPTGHRRRRGRLALITVLVVALLAGGAATVWAAGSPSREKQQLMQSARSMLEALTRGDARSIASSVQSTAGALDSPLDLSLLGPDGARAALGESPGVHIDSEGTELGEHVALVRATISTKDAILPITVRYKRQDASTPSSSSASGAATTDGAWHQVPVRFPYVSVAPQRLFGLSPTLRVNDVTLPDLPEGDKRTSVNGERLVAIWPGRTTLSAPDSQGFSWGSKDLGNVPASTFADAEPTTLSYAWYPIPQPTAGYLRAAGTAFTTWLRKQADALEKSPNDRKLRRILPFFPPLATDREGVPTVRGLTIELGPVPEPTLESRLSSQLGTPGTVTARFAPRWTKYTGQWDDGGTWRDFTYISGYYYHGTLSDSGARFTPDDRY